MTRDVVPVNSANHRTGFVWHSGNNFSCLRFEILSLVLPRIQVFWDVTLCRRVGDIERFDWSWYLCLRVRNSLPLPFDSWRQRHSDASNLRETNTFWYSVIPEDMNPNPQWLQPSMAAIWCKEELHNQLPLLHTLAHAIKMCVRGCGCVATNLVCNGAFWGRYASDWEDSIMMVPAAYRNTWETYWRLMFMYFGECKVGSINEYLYNAGWM